MAEKNQVDGAVFIVDLSYKITGASGTVVGLPGVGAGEEIGNYYGDIFKFKNVNDSAPVADLVERAMNLGKSDFDTNVLIVKKDGDTAPVSVSVIPLIDKEGRSSGAAVMIRNVSEQVTSSFAQNDLLPITVHELRSPLGGMRWSLEMLMSGDAGQLPEVAQDMVNQIHQNNQKLIDLVNDLLDVWRLDQKSVTVRPESLDLATAIDLSLGEIKLEAAAKNIDIRTSVKEGSLPKTMVDPRLFGKIIHNLLSNAIKYSPASGTVDIRGGSADGYVTVSIVDHGMGIPKADQNRIFSKFFRARNAILNEVAGTGLGLFIARSYAEALGGEICFESEENKGSTFFIKLPIAK